jgi:hypothetical protein
MLMMLSTPFANAQSAMSNYLAVAEAYMSASSDLGVSVSILTHAYNIDEADISGREDAFWVGSNLDNGAFIQFGYTLLERYTCLKSIQQLNGTFTCSGGWEQVLNGDARWFWEYWPDREGRLGIYSQLGPSMSAGKNATWHTYSIADSSNVSWSFAMDGEQVASLSIKPSAASDAPFVAAEQVTPVAPMRLGPVEFRNLSYLSSGTWHPVDFLEPIKDCEGSGLSYCSFSNPYNVTLLGLNDVIVGSLTSSQTSASSTSTMSSTASSSTSFKILPMLVVFTVVVVACLFVGRKLRKKQPTHANPSKELYDDPKQRKKQTILPDFPPGYQ